MADVVILAGGRGTRLGPLGKELPKALVPIAGRPIIEHVIAMFARAGFGKVIIATGFLNDKIEAHFKSGLVQFGDCSSTVECVYTGAQTNTAGRVRRIRDRLKSDQLFVANADGLTDLNPADLLKSHKSTGSMGTITVVPPPMKRFGIVRLEDHQVRTFSEKPAMHDQWISAGIYALDRSFIEYIAGDADSLEVDTFPALTSRGLLGAYRHDGFWRCMDMPSEAAALDGILRSGHVRGVGAA